MMMTVSNTKANPHDFQQRDEESMARWVSGLARAKGSVIKEYVAGEVVGRGEAMCLMTVFCLKPPSRA
jgi:hypothetical protein